MGEFEEFLTGKLNDGSYQKYRKLILPYAVCTDQLKQWIKNYFQEMLTNNQEEYLRVFGALDYKPKLYGESKDFKSVYRKVFEEEIREQDIIQLKDLARARVVCRYLSQVRYLQENMVHDYLCNVKGAKLLENETKDYIAKAKKSGYRAFNSHLSTPVNMASYKGEIRCEFQICTELQEVWAQCDHPLIYKNFALKRIPLVEKKNLLKQMSTIADFLYSIDELLDSARIEILRITKSHQNHEKNQKKSKT